MNRLWRHIGAVVSILFMLSCGGKTPEELANEWCELNYQYTQPDADKEEIFSKLNKLEIKIKNKFGDNNEALKKIEQITFDCDTTAE